MNNKNKAILVISFGTSHRETREKTIEAIETDIRESFPGYEFRRAITSPTIIQMMQSREGIQVDNLEQALERLLQDGYRHVVAQPTHVIHGFEYDRMAEMIGQYREQFEVLAFGEPLFDTEEDYRKAAEVLGEELAEYQKPGTEIVLIGHGTDHEAHDSYEKFVQVLEEKGMKDFSVGTVERVQEDIAFMGLASSRTGEGRAATGKTGEDGSEEERAEESGAADERTLEHVVLVPLLVVAGMHAARDIAGDGEDSWKSRFERAGYSVDCVMRGLGEYAGIRQIYVRHAKAAEQRAARQAEETAQQWAENRIDH